MAYKKDQGRYARMVTYWVLLLVIVSGLWGFHYWLDSTFFTKEGNQVVSVPLGIFDLSVSILISAILAAGFALFLHRILNRPKVADLLIETESELKKCNWPTRQETWNNSLIVLVTVVVFMVFLAGSDSLLKLIFDRIIFFGL